MVRIRIRVNVRVEVPIPEYGYGKNTCTTTTVGHNRYSRAKLDQTSLFSAGMSQTRPYLDQIIAACCTQAYGGLSLRWTEFPVIYLTRKHRYH